MLVGTGWELIDDFLKPEPGFAGHLVEALKLTKIDHGVVPIATASTAIDVGFKVCFGGFSICFRYRNDLVKGK